MKPNPSSPSKCGQHAVLTSNAALRITQCGCGTYHVTFVRRAMVMQMTEAEVRALAEGLGIALRVADAQARGRALAKGSGPPAN
ncbi:MAG: hypothetical protein MUF34_21805 [Polyangiaceae bacterium]|jgi:hypothetical protein|nr:hypothetical protein [Polyangiaceae bacterium]